MAPLVSQHSTVFEQNIFTVLHNPFLEKKTLNDLLNILFFNIYFSPRIFCRIRFSTLEFSISSKVGPGNRTRAVWFRDSQSNHCYCTSVIFLTAPAPQGSEQREVGRNELPKLPMLEPHITSLAFISSFLNHFPIT